MNVVHIKHNSTTALMYIEICQKYRKLATYKMQKCESVKVTNYIMQKYTRSHFAVYSQARVKMRVGNCESASGYFAS